MTTAMTTQQPQGLSLASFDDALRFAKMVSASDFAPKDFKGKPESCLLAIQHGSEVGLSPMQSLQSIAVINGRPCVWGDAALALVQSSPSCEYVREYLEGEGETLTAVCEAKRRGYPQPTIERFSMADAKRAGLAGKTGPWSQYPSRMLALRARGFALRNAFADALRGLVTAEEAQDYSHSPASEPARPAAPPELMPRLTVQHEPTPMEKARLSVSRASTIERCDALRKMVTERLLDGTFGQAEHDEIAGLLVTKAELLIGSEVAA